MPGVVMSQPPQRKSFLGSLLQMAAPFIPGVGGVAAGVLGSALGGGGGGGAPGSMVASGQNAPGVQQPSQPQGQAFAPQGSQQMTYNPQTQQPMSFSQRYQSPYLQYDPRR